MITIQQGIGRGGGGGGIRVRVVEGLPKRGMWAFLLEVALDLRALK